MRGKEREQKIGKVWWSDRKSGIVFQYQTWREIQKTTRSAYSFRTRCHQPTLREPSVTHIGKSLGYLRRTRRPLIKDYSPSSGYVRREDEDGVKKTSFGGQKMKLVTQISDQASRVMMNRSPQNWKMTWLVGLKKWKLRTSQRVSSATSQAIITRGSLRLVTDKHCLSHPNELRL